MRVAVIANSSWYLWNFRRRLLERLRDEGHEPIAVSPVDPYAAQLAASGFQHIDWPMHASSTHPWHELRSVWRLRRVLRSARADVLLSYTPKGNIYTGFASMGTSMAFVPNVSGLGSGFLGEGMTAALLRRMFKLTFARARHVFFQNPDDEQLFIQTGVVDSARCSRVPGSGVDLARFSPSPLPLREPRTLLYVGRLLTDKGVRELVDAVRMLKSSGLELDIRLLGPADARNPTAITFAEVEQWVAAGLVRYLGTADDVRGAIADADAVVLPSYREGTPRSLLEASAMGRPCITTDVPGCRSVVVDGVTGWLVKARDAGALAQAIRDFATSPTGRLEQMGAAARARMQAEFDEAIVLERYTMLLRRLG